MIVVFIVIKTKVARLQLEKTKHLLVRCLACRFSFASDFSKLLSLASRDLRRRAAY